MSMRWQLAIACLIVAAAVGGVALVRAATTARVDVIDVHTRQVVNFQLGVGTCHPDESAHNSCPGNFVRLLPQIETPDDVTEDVVAHELGIALPGQVTVTAVCGSGSYGGAVIVYPSGTRYSYRVRISPPFFRTAKTSRTMTAFVPDGNVQCMPTAG